MANLGIFEFEEYGSLEIWVLGDQGVRGFGDGGLGIQDSGNRGAGCLGIQRFFGIFFIYDLCDFFLS